MHFYQLIFEVIINPIINISGSQWQWTHDITNPSGCVQSNFEEVIQCDWSGFCYKALIYVFNCPICLLANRGMFYLDRMSQ